MRMYLRFYGSYAVTGVSLYRSLIFPPLFCSNGLSAILSQSGRRHKFRSHIHTSPTHFHYSAASREYKWSLPSYMKGFSSVWSHSRVKKKKVNTNETGLCWKSLPIFRLSQRGFSSLISAPHTVHWWRPRARCSRVRARLEDHSGHFIITFTWHWGWAAFYALFLTVVRFSKYWHLWKPVFLTMGLPNMNICF